MRNDDGAPVVGRIEDIAVMAKWVDTPTINERTWNELTPALSTVW